jgi:membrane AbrB-like protein
MSFRPDPKAILTTLHTLAIGAFGAVVAYYLSFPVYILIGPAILISIVGLLGLKLAIAIPLRDAAFLLIGIGIGAGVNADASVAFLRWPFAFLALAIMLFAILLVCRFMLVKFFGFDRRSAILAATPGHLSFVISTGISLDLDTVKIAVVQSVRLLALTLAVPFVAIAFGIDVGTNILPPGDEMQTTHMIALIASALVVGLVLKKFNVPAALLIGGLITSSLAHLTDTTPGVLTPKIVLPCFLIMGTLIGTRFSGITLAQLRSALLAGLCTTLVSVSFAAIAAIPIAAILYIPSAHVIVAFAPGGLETMIAMGSFLGASPGFVAACHVGRLLLLTFLVPLMLGRRKLVVQD